MHRIRPPSAASPEKLQEELSGFLRREAVKPVHIDPIKDDEHIWDLAALTYLKADQSWNRFRAARAYGRYMYSRNDPNYNDFPQIKTNNSVRHLVIADYVKRYALKNIGEKGDGKYSTTWIGKFYHGVIPIKNYIIEFKHIRLHKLLNVDETWFYDENPNRRDIPEWLLPYIAALGTCDIFIKIHLSGAGGRYLTDLDYETPMENWINYIYSTCNANTEGVTGDLSNFVRVYPFLQKHMTEPASVQFTRFELDATLDIISYYLNLTPDEFGETHIGDPVGFDSYSEKDRRHILSWVHEHFSRARHTWASTMTKHWADKEEEGDAYDPG